MVFGLFFVQKMPTNMFDSLWKTNLLVNIDAQKIKQINMFLYNQKDKNQGEWLPKEGS